VPYGKVWRTGANTITTISFSDPVTIEGKPLDKGVYGFHAIPNADRWTLIFSRNSTTWGSFTYDAAEDALRVDVTPHATDMHEALTYEFTDLQPASTVIALEWEKLAVPFRVAVDVHAVVEASIKRQLRTLQRYTWMGWNDAANYLLTESVALDDALTYANRSIQNEDRFDNEVTKSKVLLALHRDNEATVAEARALELGSATQVNDYAMDLWKTKRDARAFAMLRDNARRHPDAWIAHEGLARAYSAQGKFADASKEIAVALAAAPPEEKSALADLGKKVAAHQDIND
jgi:tetratricopeptide (TPR) repeat protein